MATKHSWQLIERCRLMRANGSSVRDIAAATGIPRSTIYQIITCQVRAPAASEIRASSGWRPWFEPDVEYVRQNAGVKSVDAIALNLGRTIHAVRTLAAKEGISLAARNVVDPHDEWLCCELYKEGLKIKIIAEKMELNRNTVSQIIKSRGLR
ncbi:TPA: helix-turn-helix domain-containing protein [Escherichia coli]|nr:helix-turn-helix domain-containing protein [Escherichia coli]